LLVCQTKIKTLGKTREDTDQLLFYMEVLPTLWEMVNIGPTPLEGRGENVSILYVVAKILLALAKSCISLWGVLISSWFTKGSALVSKLVKLI